MDNSNETMRFCRTSQEAIGYRLQSWHFPPPNPEIGDKAVGIALVVIPVLLLIGRYVFGWQIGG